MPEHRSPTPPLSRTQRKLQAQRLQRLGERLVTLPPDQADTIPMSEELAAAVAEAREMHQHGARRRQLQYIGALMRELDPEPIEQAMDRLGRGDRLEVHRFKQVERWRDALLAGEETVIAEILRCCPLVDADRIGRLVADAQGAKTSPSRRKAARSLCRYLKSNIVTDEKSG